MVRCVDVAVDVGVFVKARVVGVLVEDIDEEEMSRQKICLVTGVLSLAATRKVPWCCPTQSGALSRMLLR